MSGSCRKPKDPVREFFVQVHFCTTTSHFSLPATHENVVTQCDPPPYDNTHDQCTAEPCPRSDACPHPPPPTRPWRSRERPRGGIGSGGQYFAGSRSRRPQDLAPQYPVPSVFRFREWKICRCFGGTVVYVLLVGTIIYLPSKL